MAQTGDKNSTSVFTSLSGDQVVGPGFGSFYTGVTNNPFLATPAFTDSYLEYSKDVNGNVISKLNYPFNPDEKGGAVYVFSDNAKSVLYDKQFKITGKNAEPGFPETDMPVNVWVSCLDEKNCSYNISVLDRASKNPYYQAKTDTLKTTFFGANQTFSLAPIDLDTDPQPVLALRSSLYPTTSTFDFRVLANNLKTPEFVYKDRSNNFNNSVTNNKDQDAKLDQYMKIWYFGRKNGSFAEAPEYRQSTNIPTAFEVCSVVSSTPPISDIRNTFFPSKSTETVDAYLYYYSFLSDGLILVFAGETMSAFPKYGLNNVSLSNVKCNYLGCIAPDKFNLIGGTTSAGSVGDAYTLYSSLSAYDSTSALKFWFYDYQNNAAIAKDVTADLFSVKADSAQSSATLTFTPSMTFPSINVKYLYDATLLNGNSKDTNPIVKEMQINESIQCFLTSKTVGTKSLPYEEPTVQGQKTIYKASLVGNYFAILPSGTFKVVLDPLESKSFYLAQEPIKCFVAPSEGTVATTPTTLGGYPVSLASTGKQKNTDDTIFCLIDVCNQNYFQAFGGLRAKNLAKDYQKVTQPSESNVKAFTMYVNRMYGIQTSWSSFKLGNKSSTDPFEKLQGTFDSAVTGSTPGPTGFLSTGFVFKQGPCVSFFSKATETTYVAKSKENINQFTRWACFPFTGTVLYGSSNEGVSTEGSNLRSLQTSSNALYYDAAFAQTSQTVDVGASRIIRLSTVYPTFHSSDINGAQNDQKITNPVTSRKQHIEFLNTCRDCLNNLFSIKGYDQLHRYPVDPAKFKSVGTRMKVPLEFARVDLQSTLSGPALRLELGIPLPHNDVLETIKALVQNLTAIQTAILTANKTSYPIDDSTVSKFKILFDQNFLSSFDPSLAQFNSLPKFNKIICYPFTNFIQSVFDGTESNTPGLPLSTSLKEFVTAVENAYANLRRSDANYVAIISSLSLLLSNTDKLKRLISQSPRIVDLQAKLRNILGEVSNGELKFKFENDTKYSLGVYGTKDDMKDTCNDGSLGDKRTAVATFLYHSLSELFKYGAQKPNDVKYSTDLFSMYKDLFFKVLLFAKNCFEIPAYIAPSKKPLDARTDTPAPSYTSSPLYNSTTTSPLNTLFKIYRSFATESARTDLFNSGLSILREMGCIFTSEELKYSKIFDGNASLFVKFTASPNSDVIAQSLLNDIKSGADDGSASIAGKLIDTSGARNYKSPDSPFDNSRPNPGDVSILQCMLDVLSQVNIVSEGPDSGSAVNDQYVKFSLLKSTTVQLYQSLFDLKAALAVQTAQNPIKSTNLLDAFSTYVRLSDLWSGLRTYFNSTAGDVTTDTNLQYNVYQTFLCKYDELFELNKPMFNLLFIYYLGKFNDQFADSTKSNVASRVSLSSVPSTTLYRYAGEFAIPILITLDVENQQSTFDNPLFLIRPRDTKWDNVFNDAEYQKFASDLKTFLRPGTRSPFVHQHFQNEILRFPVKYLLAKMKNEPVSSESKFEFEISYNNTSPAADVTLQPLPQSNIQRVNVVDDNGEPDLFVTPSNTSTPWYQYLLKYNTSKPVEIDFNGQTIAPQIASLGDQYVVPNSTNAITQDPQTIVTPEQQFPPSNSSTDYYNQLSTQQYDDVFMQKMISLVSKMVHCVCLPNMDLIRSTDLVIRAQCLFDAGKDYSNSAIPTDYAKGSSARCLSSLVEPTYWIHDDVNPQFMNDRLSRNATPDISFCTQFMHSYSRIDGDVNKRFDRVDGNDRFVSGVKQQLGIDITKAKPYTPLTNPAVDDVEQRLNTIESVLINVPQLLMNIPVDSPLRFGIQIRWRIIDSNQTGLNRRFVPEKISIVYDVNDLDLDGVGAGTLQVPKSVPTDGEINLNVAGVDSKALIEQYRVNYLLSQLKQLQQLLVKSLCDLKKSQRYFDLLNS